jgi:PqqD family protein of HPr-rel-A system
MTSTVRESKSTSTPSGYRVSQALRSSQGQDGAIVLNVRSGHMFSINCVGSLILAVLKEKPGIPEDEIAELIGKEFDLSPETAQKDLRRFLQKLIQHQLIETGLRDESPEQCRHDASRA